jgi:hypothetical protein
MPSPSFCVLPWMHAFADEAGVMWPCCRSIGSRRPNLDDRTGKPRRIHDPGGLRAGMDIQTMRRLRLDMLRGQRPPACERCYMVEDLGMRSHRQVQNAQWAGEISTLVAATGADGTLDAEVRTVDLRLGNTCNLRCRMCSPQSSQALIPEWASFHGVPRDSRHMDAFRHMDWFDDPAFWGMLQAQAPRLERIHFAGGEPLLIGRMFDYLQRLVDSGQASRTQVSYNTNLSVLPEPLFRLWSAFAGVRVTVSLDGFGPLNEFIRFPSRWSVLDANLRRLDQGAEKLNLSAGLATNTTVQIYNVFGLEALLGYLARELTRFSAPNLAILSYPEHLNLRVLPQSLKARAAASLRACLQNGTPLWRQRWGAEADSVVAGLQGIIRHMEEKDRSHLLPQFLRWARHQDRFRGQSTPLAIPELATLFPGLEDRAGDGENSDINP